MSVALLLEAATDVKNRRFMELNPSNHLIPCELALTSEIKKLLEKRQ